MTPTYMHRLNAWQITAFPERQKSNKWYKNSLLCFLYICTCKRLVVVKGEAQWACCCTAACVPNLGGRIKASEAKHQWCGFWLHPLQMEGETMRKKDRAPGGGKVGEKGLNKFSLPQTGLLDPTVVLTLIRARPASYIPPAHFQHW